MAQGEGLDTESLIERQLCLENPGSWRTFIYDPTVGRASQIRFRSHAGSASFANPTIERVVVNGRDAIVVTLFIFGEGARGGEAGELLDDRTLP